MKDISNTALKDLSYTLDMEQFNILVNKMDEKTDKIKSLCNLQDMFEDD